MLRNIPYPPEERTHLSLRSSRMGQEKNVIHRKEVKEAEMETEESLADETPKAQTSIRKGQHTLKDQL